MKPCTSSAQAAALALLLTPACGDSDSAGGGSYSASDTAPTTSTTGPTPTTSAATDTPSTTNDTDTSTSSTTTTTTTTTTTSDTPDPLVVDCGAPPAGALGATYKHKPSVKGGVPSYTWSAAGLPDGLMIAPTNGQISGVPTITGDFTIELTVQDGLGTMAMTTCPVVTIGDKLIVDYDAIEGQGPCLSAEGPETILDYLEGGDGSPITCSTPGKNGDGKLPTGLSVDPTTCATLGVLAETRYGGWAWIVQAEQSGVQVHVPYCTVQPQQTPKAYGIVGSHSGGKDNELEPLLVKFNPQEPLRLDGDADPVFDINKGTCEGNCFFAFLYRVSASPFGTGPCKDDKDGCFGLCPLVPDANEPDGDKLIQCSLLPKMGLPKLGFTHEMWAKGELIPDAFLSRPFILQWGIDYCVSNVQANCQGKDAILANGDNSNLEFPVIFRAQ